MTPTEIRLLLRSGGFDPIPLRGKNPAMKEGWQWQQLFNATPDQFDMWRKTWPDAKNTGALCRRTPAFDIDIDHGEAADAIERLVRERMEERGVVPVRFGRLPRRAIIFRTDEPFPGFKIGLIAPDGSTHKLEFLSDGQQLVVAGIHPDTLKPYTWHGGKPGKVPRNELPYIRKDDARQLVDDAVALLINEHGFKLAAGSSKGNGGGQPADWETLVANIVSGADYHDSLTRLAASCASRGWAVKQTTEFLQGLMRSSTGPHDARWEKRFKEIPRAAKSAYKKFAIEPVQTKPREEPLPEPCTIAETISVFDKWLTMQNHTPIYAVLGTVAANLLPGDAVWLGVIGPPSSAKTEILNSISLLPKVVQAATLTPAGLLSGTPKKQREHGTKGGLLNQIGDFGIIALKDFGSILSMRPDTKPEVLAALREIYDGEWTRHLGTDGGRTLHWKGKIGLLFGSTSVIDSHYTVIGAMGDRFLMTRLSPVEGQFKQALKHIGAATGQMRRDLAETVAGLFAGRRPEPRPFSEEEADQINRIITLVVRLRGTVERDRYSRDLEAVYGAEGTARIGLALERLLAGLDTLGVDRTTAMEVIESVALDSVPPIRRRAYEFVGSDSAEPDREIAYGPEDDAGKKEVLGSGIPTSAVARALGLPTNTVRRALEDLTAYELIERIGQGRRNADLWKTVR
jgi:hypothetical protein